MIGSKIEKLTELLLVSEGKSIIFSFWTQMLDQIAKALLTKGITYN